MNPRLKELYQRVILLHSKEPVNYYKQEDSPIILDAYNDLCGDKFQLFFKLEEGMIKELSFFGYGCAISKASSSVLVKSLAGKSLEEALKLNQNYLDWVQHMPDPGTKIPEEFEAFTAARDFPGRMKCATLAWEEMLGYLNKDKA